MLSPYILSVLILVIGGSARPSLDVGKTSMMSSSSSESSSSSFEIKTDSAGNEYILIGDMMVDPVVSTF